MPWTVHFKLSAKHVFSCSLACSHIWALFSKLRGSVHGQPANLLDLFIQLALATWRLTSLQRVKHTVSTAHTTVMLMEMLMAMATGAVSFLSLTPLRNCA